MSLENAVAQLHSAGLLIAGTPDIGSLVRCKVDGDTGQKKSGWYVLHEWRLDSGEVLYVGRYGNWKTMGDSSLEIAFKSVLNAAEQARLRAETLRLRQLAAQEKAERAAVAAQKAASIWERLAEVGASEYLKHKQVKAFGVRFMRGSVVVPVMNAAAHLVGLQFIAADGSKKFLTGTPKAGCFHRIGRVQAGMPLCIAEGYATAATLHQLTGWPVAVAFDAGNLLAVAQALREKYPHQKLLICADNDATTAGNPGVTKAREAARRVNALVAIPFFEPAAVRIEDAHGNCLNGVEMAA